MRLFISTATALVLSVGALMACSPQDGSAPAVKSAPAPANNNTAAQTTKPATQNPNETQRVSIEETQKAIEAGTALVVDVRDESSYKASHVKGAKSVPLSQFEARIGELPKDKLIITYCA